MMAKQTQRPHRKGEQTPSIFRARRQDPNERLPLFIAQHPTFTTCAVLARQELNDWRRVAGRAVPDPNVWVERVDTDRKGRQRVKHVAQLSGKRGA